MAERRRWRPLGSQPGREGMTLGIGDQVRLRAAAPLLRHHPALAGAIGTIRRVTKGAQWTRLTSSPAERAADVTVHVTFQPPLNVVLLNVEAGQFERLGAARAGGGRGA